MWRTCSSRARHLALNFGALKLGVPLRNLIPEGVAERLRVVGALTELVTVVTRKTSSAAQIASGLYGQQSSEQRQPGGTAQKPGARARAKNRGSAGSFLYSCVQKLPAVLDRYSTCTPTFAGSSRTWVIDCSGAPRHTFVQPGCTGFVHPECTKRTPSLTLKRGIGRNEIRCCTLGPEQIKTLGDDELPTLLSPDYDHGIMTMIIERSE